MENLKKYLAISVPFFKKESVWKGAGTKKPLIVSGFFVFIKSDFLHVFQCITQTLCGLKYIMRHFCNIFFRYI